MGYRIDSNTEFLNDPLSDNMYNRMKEYARSNTLIYREIFKCYPDDNFTKFQDIIKNKNNIIEKYDALKNNMKGNMVEFPLEFLSHENLERTYFCKEMLVPLKKFL